MKKEYVLEILNKEELEELIDEYGQNGFDAKMVSCKLNKYNTIEDSLYL